MSNNRYINTALSLGGNLGDVHGNFKKAVAKLRNSGMLEIHCSSLYRTPPVECPIGTPDFINASLTGLWQGSAHSLLELCKDIETWMGRESSHIRNAPRPLDIDIILFGSEIITLENLSIPHSEARKRLFVLVPLCEVAPEWKFPDTGMKVKNCLAKFADSEEYHKIISTKTAFP